MENQDYTVSLIVDANAEETFDGINRVSKWWNKNLEGSSENQDDEFTVRFGDVHYSRQKLVEVVPGKKIAWLVTDSHLNFIEDKQEWTNTKICFELSEQDNKTQIQFTHTGLVPRVECYEACAKGWDHYIKGSLFKYLTEGKGNPG